MKVEVDGEGIEMKEMAKETTKINLGVPLNSKMGDGI